MDVVEVGERLKGLALCDGQGPVFEEGVVLRVVGEVAEGGIGGGDELLPGGAGEY